MSDVEGRLGELERRVTNLETVNEPEQPAQHLPAGAVELEPEAEPEAETAATNQPPFAQVSGFGITGSGTTGSNDAGTVTPATPEADRPPSTEGL